MLSYFKKSRKKGALLLEYIALIIFLVLAFLGAQKYALRALSGNWRALADSFGFGRQYEEGVTVICNEGVSCDDGNPCTKDDKCDASGNCVGISDDTAPCEDGNPCTYNDGCLGGTCQGTRITCTSDQCAMRSCQESDTCKIDRFNNGVSCDDGDACTINDICQAGACKGQTISCDDSNPCTVDSSCNPATGCQHTPVSCDDSNPCTSDVCNPATGSCQHEFINEGRICNTLCNFKGTCQSGKCAGGTPKNCNDRDPCTDDYCDPATGCQHIPNLIC